MRREMDLQKIYTALLTADIAVAEGWYTKLLGRRPDYRPMDTVVQWELFDQGGLALSTDDEIAGRGVMFLIVDDVAAERRRLQGLGIVRATTRRWRRCVILTATCSRWRRRPRGPIRRHDRTGRAKSTTAGCPPPGAQERGDFQLSDNSPRPWLLKAAQKPLSLALTEEEC
jgi:hypothetical protein